jgi:hypothetical protein
MTKVHRGLLSGLSEVRAVNLNTPYGFQENVPQMTEKLLAYFSTSLHVEFAALDLRRFESADFAQRENFKSAVRQSTYVFAGPGSPSYALRQWLPLGLTDDLAAVISHGGVVCFSSAAALTLGRYTPPVYEIYKSGGELEWLEGLNLMSSLGLNCVVLPHYNNAEGRDYDTSRCYLGERRLRLLEDRLPPGVGVLGIDEHSAAIIDVEARTLSVRGKGEAHWRLDGTVADFANGSVTSLDELGSSAHVLDTLAADPPTPTSLVDESELAAMRDAQQQLVDALSTIRDDARRRGDYAVSDQIRDAIVAAGLKVADTAVSSK